MARQGRWQGDCNLPYWFVSLRGEVDLHLGHEVQDAMAMFEQPPPNLGELHAAAVAEKQGLAKLDFKRAHLTAQGRLRNAQDECCLAETAVLGHSHEVLKLVQIHRWIFAWSMPKVNSS
jgi:hypothetical protein